jgi:hypothetical protein
MRLMIFFSMPCAVDISHNVSLCTLSKTFLKWMKFINRGVFHSMHCSMIFRRANIWSIHPRPFLNPACSSLNFWSIASSIRMRMILQNTLLGTESRGIPLRLSQHCRSPFFGNLTIRSLVQSDGTVSLSQMFLKSWWNALAVVLISDF